MNFSWVKSCCALGHCRMLPSLWVLCYIPHGSIWQRYRLFCAERGEEDLGLWSSWERLGLLTMPRWQEGKCFPPTKKNVTLPTEHWLIKSLTTIVDCDVDCCIILFDFYKCRPTALENVLRLAPSAGGQSGDRALRLPSPCTVAWRLPGWQYLSIAPVWKGRCVCFVPFSTKILAINKPCYVCKGNLEHRETLLITDEMFLKSSIQ